MGDRRIVASLLLALSAGALYVACRAAIDVLARTDGASPARRALGQWLPVCATALAAVFTGHPEMATVIIFSTSVADLTLVLGLATSLAPMEATSRSRRIWPFVLPAALIPLVGGFSASLSYTHAMAMLVLGGAVLGVSRDPGTSGDSSPPVVSRWGPLQIAQLVLAVGLAGLGGWAAIHGAVAASSASQRISTGAFAAIVLSPLLVLPTLGSASSVAQHGKAGEAAAALVGTVMLNLCLLLPACVLTWHIVSAAPFMHGPGSSILSAISDHGAPLPFSPVTWRLENVLLVVLGFFLIPIAAGRWGLARLESYLLAGGYFFYLAAAWLMAI